MVSYSKELSTIKELLEQNPQGMTITDISKVLNIYRKTTAKYLDMLLITGRVEMRPFGPVKIYTPSRRIPVSTMLDFSADTIILFDSGLTIIDCNARTLSSLSLTREEIIGKHITDGSLPFSHHSILIRHITDAVGGNRYQGKIDGLALPGTLDHEVEIAPTTYDDGSDGASLRLIHDEGRHQMEIDLKRRDALLRLVSNLTSIANVSDGMANTGVSSDPNSDPTSSRNVLPLDRVHLERIGSILESSRVYLCRNGIGESGERMFTRMLEWVDSGTTELIGDQEFGRVSYQIIGYRLEETLMKGRVFVGNIRDFLEPEREFFNPQGIISLAFLPINVNGAWWGFLAIDHCDREWEWAPGEIEALRAVASIFGILMRGSGSEDSVQ
jgi:hypothetical protein